MTKLEQHIEYRQNALMGHAILTSEGSKPFHIFCNLPGGTPWASWDPLSPTGTRIPIAEAPSCLTMSQFREFVATRFG